MRVVYRLVAGRDIGEARAWYEAERLGRGLRFQHAIEGLERLIGDHHEAFPVVTGKVRRALVSHFPYALYYQPARYAAFSLMPEGVEVLTVEFKTNLLAPARGEALIARGRVVRAGRTITVCQAEASMLADGAETVVATMLATIMAVPDRPDVAG